MGNGSGTDCGELGAVETEGSGKVYGASLEIQRSRGELRTSELVLRKNKTSDEDRILLESAMLYLGLTMLDKSIQKVRVLIPV